jgi:nitrite reductase/ring-hydroxylating ferredoxin subunit
MNWPQVKMKARIIADFLGNCPTESRNLQMPIADCQIFAYLSRCPHELAFGNWKSAFGNGIFSPNHHQQSNRSS